MDFTTTEVLVMVDALGNRAETWINDYDHLTPYGCGELWRLWRLRNRLREYLYRDA